MTAHDCMARRPRPPMANQPTRWPVWAISCLLLSVALVACGKDSPTAPTSPPTTPPPSSSTYTVSGAVRGADTNGGIAGATVQIGDGPNAGKSTTTDGSGRYSLAGLVSSGFTMSVTAANYLGATRGVTLTASRDESFRLLPAQPWTRSGTGNTVFDMPSYFTRVRIQGRWLQRDTSNFIVHIGGHFVVNEILRTTITYDGIHLTEGGGVTEIVDSAAIAWTFTEIR